MLLGLWIVTIAGVLLVQAVSLRDQLAELKVPVRASEVKDADPRCNG